MSFSSACFEIITHRCNGLVKQGVIARDLSSLGLEKMTSFASEHKTELGEEYDIA